eukprot:3693173-Pyramimonas_sp.AAC.1
MSRRKCRRPVKRMFFFPSPSPASHPFSICGSPAEAPKLDPPGGGYGQAPASLRGPCPRRRLHALR